MYIYTSNFLFIKLLHYLHFILKNKYCQPHISIFFLEKYSKSKLIFIFIKKLINMYYLLRKTTYKNQYNLY